MGRLCARIVAGFVLLALLAPLASARGGSHPYFNDQGTLRWYHTLADAKRAATSEGKIIFVEYGRRRCTQCRTIVSRVLPDPRVRSGIAKIAVGLVAECDRPEAAVDSLLRRNLPSTRMLPFVAFLTADGRYITGFSGGCSVERFLAHVRKAEARLPRARPPARTPRPCSCPEPTQEPRIGSRPEVARHTPAPAPKETPRVVAPLPRPETGTVAQRPAAPGPYPEPRLEGDPDGGRAPEMGGCCALPPRTSRTGPLPAPRVTAKPPLLVARDAPGERSTTQRQPTRRAGKKAVSLQRRAETAARNGEWNRVLEIAGDGTANPALVSLCDQAHEWAHRQLAAAVGAIAQERYEDGLAGVESVFLHMRGQPEAVDAQRGLTAIRTLLELRYLSPDGEVAKAVRQKAFEELRGTRWARLFRP